MRIALLGLLAAAVAVGCQVGAQPGRSPATPKTPPTAKSAAKKEAAPGLGEKLDPIVARLSDKKAKTRLEAVSELASLGAEAAPATRHLCAAMLDPLPAVRVAALAAVEKTAPKLHTQLQTMAVDAKQANRDAALARIGKMGEDGRPAVPFLLGRLNAETAAAGGKRLDTGGADRRAKLVAAVQATGCDAPETVAAFKALGGGGVKSDAQLLALKWLRTWAVGDGERREDVAGLFVSGLADPTCRAFCIETCSEYGAACRGALPRLRALKDSPDLPTRRAAAAAIAAIEK